MTAVNTLHILNKPPEHSRYRLCLAALGPQDMILLIENGVLALARPLEFDVRQCLALAPDLEARGLADRIEKGRSLSYHGMVELAASAKNVISW